MPLQSNVHQPSHFCGLDSHSGTKALLSLIRSYKMDQCVSEKKTRQHRHRPRSAERAWPDPPAARGLALKYSAQHAPIIRKANMQTILFPNTKTGPSFFKGQANLSRDDIAPAETSELPSPSDSYFARRISEFSVQRNTFVFSVTPSLKSKTASDMCFRITSA